MLILHCIKKNDWESLKNETHFGHNDMAKDGFIHCSPIEYFWRVAPNFKDKKDEMVLLCIETEFVNAPIKWEDGDNCGRHYPHVYGPIETIAVQNVLPFHLNASDEWDKNPELGHIPNK